MMTKLTDKEKIVLYGLIRHPELNDIELGGRIDIKRPTITAIRNRLEKQRIFSTIRIPDLSRLGCEVITATFTEYNPLTPFNARGVVEPDNPSTFFEIITHSKQFTLSATKNYTEARRQVEDHIVYGYENDYFNIEDLSTTSIPLPSSKIFMFFDYSHVLRNHFDIDADSRMICDPRVRVVKPYDFDPNEKKVYQALIECPTLRETVLAKNISMSRGAVHDICKRFREESLYNTVRIPDLKSLGFELIVYNRIYFSPLMILPKRKSNIEQAINDGHHFLIIAGAMESSTLSAFTNYTDFQDRIRQLTEYGRKRGYLRRDPDHAIFPFEDVNYFAGGRFGGVVKTLLAD